MIQLWHHQAAGAVEPLSNSLHMFGSIKQSLCCSENVQKSFFVFNISVWSSYFLCSHFVYSFITQLQYPQLSADGRNTSVPTYSMALIISSPLDIFDGKPKCYNYIFDLLSRMCQRKILRDCKEKAAPWRKISSLPLQLCSEDLPQQQ